MTYVCYDGSYEGLLCAIYDIYAYKINEPIITNQANGTGSLFEHNHIVYTHHPHAQRVLEGLKRKISEQGLKEFMAAFLSGITGIEKHLGCYAQMVFNQATLVNNNYANDDILAVKNASQKVFKEVHRMQGFIRFKKTVDEIYYAVIEPDHDILPLLWPHFKNRYSDQQWLIYDARRLYGLRYDLSKVDIVTMDNSTLKEHYLNAHLQNSIHPSDEHLYEKLWQRYFTSTSIADRKNTRLHVQHMPKRYWKYLVEKVNL